MRQRLAEELLDTDAGSAAEITRSLGDLWWINRRLGGCSSWRRLLQRWLGSLSDLPHRLSLLDVGSGTGEMAAHCAGLLRQSVPHVHLTVCDRQASHLSPAARPAIVADTVRLPFADRAFDLVTSNLFLHHFHGDAALALLREQVRVARLAVLVNDLERAWPPWLLITAISPFIGRITRYDGPRSIRQAYTAPEMIELGRGTGAAVETVRLWPYRLGMILRPAYV